LPTIAEEYRIISSGAGWSDRSARGRLRFEGPDALTFLQALLTNDVATLVRGEGRYSAYLAPNGRMVADIELLHRGDWVLGRVAPAVAPSLAARFDGLIFAENLRVVDVSASLYELALVGERAADLISRAFGIDRNALSTLPESSQLDWASGFAARSGGAPLPVFSLYGPADERDAAIRRLEDHGASEITGELVEALRVMAGRPAWGAELTEQVIPLEAGLLDRAINTTKGCYVGQEIIIRMLHRGGGRVAKRLVMLQIEPPAADDRDLDSSTATPAPGATLVDAAGASIGMLTSVASSPTSSGLIALGYLRDDRATLGATVTIAGTTTTALVKGFGG